MLGPVRIFPPLPVLALPLSADGGARDHRLHGQVAGGLQPPFFNQYPRGAELDGSSPPTAGQGPFQEVLKHGAGLLTHRGPELTGTEVDRADALALVGDAHVAASGGLPLSLPYAVQIKSLSTLICFLRLRNRHRHEKQYRHHGHESLLQLPQHGSHLNHTTITTRSAESRGHTCTAPTVHAM